MKTPKLKKVKVVTYYYEVTNSYGVKSSCENIEEAKELLKFANKEKKVLDLIKPKGVTLVLSKHQYYYYKVIPAFIGFNGVPFCEANKDKGKEYFYNGINSIEDHFSRIYGNLPTVLARAYKLLDGRESFDRWDGAYHYYWNTQVGNTHCIATPVAWKYGALWYNWDGENFTTNDKDCKVTNEDIILALHEKF